MAKHGQIMAMAPGQGDPQAAAQAACRAARAAWQVALGAPKALPQGHLPPKVGLKGLGEVPAGDSGRGGAALRAFPWVCEDPL